MRKCYIFPVLVLALLIAAIPLQAAIKTNFGTFTPFAFIVEQQQPVQIVVSVPIDGKIITATVPMTVSVTLQVEVTGGGNASVTMLDTKPASVKALPVVGASAAITDEQIDALGIPFSMQVEDGIEILEWTVYDKKGEMAVVGKLKNTDETRQFSLVDFSLRLFGDDGKLIGAASGYAGGRWVRPGQTLLFDLDGLAQIDEFSRYEVVVAAGDWMDAP